MENKLFRKSALDRISSPEQLNEYMKVAGPGVWWIMAGIAVTFAAFFLWGITGSIPETVDVSGTTLAPGGSPMAVYCYLPVEYSKLVAEGMKVRVSPDYAPRERYGYIYGEIVSESSSAVNIEEVQERLGSDFDLINIPSDNVIEVIIELERVYDELFWSTLRGESVDVIVGSTCQVTI